MARKTILVLANSVKIGGRCIAGREVDLSQPNIVVGPWLRPVSPNSEAKEGELIPTRHCTMRQGGTPAVLDVVEVPINAKCDAPGQPENWEVQSRVAWNRVKRVSSSGLQRLAETPSDLWLDGGNRIDRIAVESQLERSDSASLVLIQPSQFRIRMWTEFNQWKGYNQSKIRGVFTYAGVEYDLPVTDDQFTSKHCPRPGGVTAEFTPHFGDSCLFCVSLGAAFGGYHYKLIAAIIPLQ